MKHAALFKKILAFTLAALIGLSALSGVLMAFADEKKNDYDYELETTSYSVVYVECDDDFALVVPDGTVTDLTLEFEDIAAFSVKLGEKRSLWVGYTTQYNKIIEQLADENSVSFDVLNFIFSPAFDNEGTLTYTTAYPYLYRLEGRTLTPVTSAYADGVHTFTTDTLGCFLAANNEINL